MYILVYIVDHKYKNRIYVELAHLFHTVRFPFSDLCSTLEIW